MPKKVHFLAVLAFLVILTGCIKNYADQGYASNFSELAASEERIVTKDQVKHKLGSPSTISTFGDETWFYIRSRTEQAAFLDSKMVDQEVLSISFDKDGNISKVDHYTLKDGRRIEFAKDTTPTEGNELGLTEQLLGNLGRFNPKQE